MNTTDIAEFLTHNPQFFEEHAELLGRIKLTSPVMGKAISLQERQMEILREKHRTLELNLAELLRVAHENDAISSKFQRWTRALLAARNDVDLPHVLTHGLQDIFDVPFASLRLWDVAEEYSHTWFAEPVTEDIQLFAKGLSIPFCGKNLGFEAAEWLDSEDDIASMAMLPLRVTPTSPAFGLLVLGSPELSRFTKEMATDFLSSIADTSSAALAFLSNQD
jgi:uncharacterized protein